MAIHQASKSLQARQSPLSSTFYQLDVLQHQPGATIPAFIERLQSAGVDSLRPATLDILQVNVGKLCNQSCAHCHVDAGPDRREIMSRETLSKCLQVVDQHQIPTVDITGGAPELNPHFRWFVGECRARGVEVINRCNLTIIVSNPKYHDLPEFFARHQVQLVSSLPHFNKLRTDHQRGDGVFEDSIKALRMLNDVGYGRPDTGLALHLVHNPSGAFLPGNQSELEAEFKRQLKRKFDIDFNQLYVITNLPVSRFLEYLLASGNYETYMQSLSDAFNPATVGHLMCRNTLSVSWDGYLYDCDFNQMLELKVAVDRPHIMDFDLEALRHRSIVTHQHCYGCTAGAGSSCGGELV